MAGETVITIIGESDRRPGIAHDVRWRAGRVVHDRQHAALLEP